MLFKLNKIKTLFFILLYVGCSFYSFKGSIPSHIKSVYMSPIGNNTTEVMASDIIKIELENAFIDQNILKLLPLDNSTSQLDVVLISFKDKADSYDIDDLSSTGYETVNEYRVTIKAKVTWYDLVKNELLFEGEFIGWGAYDPNQQDIGNDQIDNDNDTYIDGEDDDEYGPPRESAIKIASSKISDDIINSIVSTW